MRHMRKKLTFGVIGAFSLLCSAFQLGVQLPLLLYALSHIYRKNKAPDYNCGYRYTDHDHNNTFTEHCSV